MPFRTVLLLNGKSATGIRVPDEVVERLGAGKRPPVRVTINGYTYRSTVAPRYGGFMLPVSAEHRAGAGIAAGDEIEVHLELDSEPREVAVPPDLADALDGDPSVRRAFDALSYTRKKEHVRGVEDAKTPETRQRRIAGVVRALREG